MKITENKLLLFVLVLVGCVFLFFSYLQINDPDSFFWIFAYLIPAILTFLSILNYGSKFLLFLSPVYFIISIYLYFNNGETKVLYIFSEATNESLGLILCSIWIFILPWLNNKMSLEKVNNNS